MGSDLTEIPGTILDPVFDEVGRVTDKIFPKAPKGPDVPTLPVVPPPAAVIAQREADAARRDLDERRRRAQGRSQSNLRIPSLVEPIQTQRPQLEAKLG